MWRTTEGSTGRLVQLCLGYFFFYVITGITVKYFLGSALHGLPGMHGIEFLVYSTAGGAGIALLVAVGSRWYRLKSNRMVQWGRLRFPGEFLYIIPSGVCTAVVIPTTTLMYTLPISVMVAMVIMRGAIIVISRLVDAVQIRQGILTKKVYFVENLAVAFALMAMGVEVLWTPTLVNPVVDALGRMGVRALLPLRIGAESGPAKFEFWHSTAALTILGSYIVAYMIRIYIMNYYKNTRGKGMKLDNKGFFAIEQIAASGTMLGVALLLLGAPRLFGSTSPQIEIYRGAFLNPKPLWSWAILSGVAYGAVAFFSVFIFMFKGRTATFAGLVNRLTSLVAGTASTLVFHFAFGGSAPKPEDWVSLVFVLAAVLCLSVAERRRMLELVVTLEVELAPGAELEGGHAAPSVA